jgi:host factor-I protein
MPYQKEPPVRDNPSRASQPRDASREGQARDAKAGGGRDSKNAAQPNIQDVFLNYARREKLLVVIRLLDGQTLEGRIKNFDRFAVVVDHAGTDHMVFKHAIATIKSPRSVGSYYAPNEPQHPAG